ncbi:MAG: hypothetical protein ABJA18_12695 [bacterium]
MILCGGVMLCCFAIVYLRLSLDLTMVQKVIAGAVAVAILVVVINFAEVRWRMTDEAGRNKSG